MRYDCKIGRDLESLLLKCFLLYKTVNSLKVNVISCTLVINLLIYSFKKCLMSIRPTGKVLHETFRERQR